MRILMYVAQAYSFEILRPLQAVALARGDEVCWFIASGVPSCFGEYEAVVSSLSDVEQFDPEVVFVPGNDVPAVFPGLKVQVFHGFGIEKKGHFRIRGMFQLYCTHGPLNTGVFQRLANKYGNFLVQETGWPKVDPLFLQPKIERDAGVGPFRVLYAPTFSPSLTSAKAVLTPIVELAQRYGWEWHVKFHPKMKTDFSDPWRALKLPNLRIVSEESILPELHWADVMLTDTSSVAAEFMLLDKPVVTYNNSRPGPHLINVTKQSELEKVLVSLAEPGEAGNTAERRAYAAGMHKFSDGKSSERVLAVVDRVLQDGSLASLHPLPRQRYRQWRIRRRLGL